jgi:hypothetical protein
METDCQRVGRFLEAELKTAIERRDVAIANLAALTQEIPSGIPDPAGSQRIVDASAEYTSAHKGLTRALQHLSDFQLSGIVPEDLKKDYSTSGAGHKKG